MAELSALFIYQGLCSICFKRPSGRPIVMNNFWSIGDQNEYLIFTYSWPSRSLSNILQLWLLGYAFLMNILFFFFQNQLNTIVKGHMRSCLFLKNMAWSLTLIVIKESLFSYRKTRIERFIGNDVHQSECLRSLASKKRACMHVWAISVHLCINFEKKLKINWCK